MPTISAKLAEVKREWYVVDAGEKVLGRMASAIATRLRGKHKPEYTPHVDTGDHVVVINAARVKVTGRKGSDKIYHRHSGFPGGLRSMSFDRLQERAPGRVVELAVKGMLPRGPLGRAMFRKLHVYSGSTHPHVAQQPKPLDL